MRDEQEQRHDHDAAADAEERAEEAGDETDQDQAHAAYATRVAVATDALLDRLTAAPDEAGIFLDFDGVLAPIVERPEDAYPPAETRAELARLVGRYALVAVVSGRAGDDVRERVGVDGVVYRRLARARARPRRPTAGGSRSSTSRRRRAWPPSEIELKGLSVAFHFRAPRRRSRGGARARGDRGARARRGPRRALRPQGARGAAAGRLEQGHGGAAPARGRRAARACSSRATTRPTSTRSAPSRSIEHTRARRRARAGVADGARRACGARARIDRRVPRAAAQALVHVDERCSRRCASGSASRSMLPWEGEISDVEWAIATYNPRARTT